jgi:hypothetical protein
MSPDENKKSLAGILCNVGPVYGFALAAIGAMNRLNFFRGGTPKVTTGLENHAF